MTGAEPARWIVQAIVLPLLIWNPLADESTDLFHISLCDNTKLHSTHRHPGVGLG